MVVAPHTLSPVVRVGPWLQLLLGRLREEMTSATEVIVVDFFTGHITS